MPDLHPSLLPQPWDQLRKPGALAAYVQGLQKERPSITRREMARHLMEKFKVREGSAYRWIRRVRDELTKTTAEGQHPQPIRSNPAATGLSN